MQKWGKIEREKEREELGEEKKKRMGGKKKGAGKKEARYLQLKTASPAK